MLTIHWLHKWNNTQIDNAKYIDVVIPMYNLIEYSNNYSKTSGSLWQYYRDDPNDNIAQSESFKYKIKIMRKTHTASNTKDVEIVVPLKYLSNFWRTLEMPLINCEITKFKIADTKLSVPVVTLPTHDDAKLLQLLKSGFKRTINWKKHQLKLSPEIENQYLNFLIDPRFQGVNRHFVLSHENENVRKVHTWYYLPTVEIKDYNVMIDGKNLFDQSVKLIWEHMITFVKLRQAKEMITQLVVR